MYSVDKASSVTVSSLKTNIFGTGTMCPLLLYENRPSQLQTQLLQLRKESPKKNNEQTQRPAPSWLITSIGKSTAPVTQRSRARIP